MCGDGRLRPSSEAKRARRPCREPLKSMIRFLLTGGCLGANMASYDMSSKDTIEALPLTEPVLLILLSLAAQPQHGYSILKDVERMSNGRVVLSTGTLYGALRRLLDDDWIERFEEEESPRGRQAYRLTPQGRRNLQLEIDRMKHITRLATLRVATKES
jgi:DNA-binding PadR family transcriptional regulator